MKRLKFPNWALIIRDRFYTIFDKFESKFRFKMSFRKAFRFLNLESNRDRRRNEQSLLR